jgi:hypothetical protein
MEEDLENEVVGHVRSVKLGPGWLSRVFWGVIFTWGLGRGGGKGALTGGEQPLNGSGERSRHEAARGGASSTNLTLKSYVGAGSSYL